MFGSWFARTAPPEEDKDEEKTALGAQQHREPGSQLRRQDTAREDNGSAQVSRPIASPHDAILSELFYTPSAEVQAAQPSTTGVNPQSHAQDADVHQSSQTLDSHAASHTEAAAAATRPEPLHDPFSGELVGMVMSQSDGFDFEGQQTDFDRAKDDLWIHLGRIRQIQADIAKMHLKMETVGIDEPGRHKPGSGSSDFDTSGLSGLSGSGLRASMRRISTTGTMGDWDEAEEDEEAERKKAREAEFSALASKFTGQKKDINAIMDKLDELSTALTDFHALPTPVVSFTPSRKSTQEQDVSTPNSRQNTAGTSPMRSPTMSPESVSGLFGSKAYSSPRMTNPALSTSPKSIASPTLPPHRE